MDRESWNDRYEGRELLWTAAPNQFLVAEVSSLAPGTALDLGCGEGRNAVWLAEQGWQVTAVDFSSVAIAKGRELATARGVEVTWVSEDLSHYEPRKGSVDLVIVFYIHVPFDERKAILERGSDALAPGGTLLVVGHDLTNLDHGYGGPQDAALLYTADDIVSAMPGLEVVKAERVERVVENDEGRFVAFDALVRVTRRDQSPAGLVR